MPTLKEIKGRIGSVRSTLKITSAMKLVSSAKLRKAQQAIESMRPYEQQLQRILAAATGTPSTESAHSVLGGPQIPGPSTESAHSVLGGPQTPGPSTDGASSPRVIIAIASNSSLCGGFNAAAIAQVRARRHSGDVVYSIGRKMADAMRRDGFPSPADYTALSEHPSYAPCADLVEKLSEDLASGRISEVLLVYNHFVSTARQTPVVERLLPAAASVIPGLDRTSEMAGQLGNDDAPFSAPVSGLEAIPDAIIEPGRRELLAVLLPKTLKLKLYAAVLDSAAAEHAARTVAMQAATDNGNDLLEELTLQYNKGRQQKITNEILDLAAGQTE